jgi:REP element-mobilizing transposase RayT
MRHRLYLHVAWTTRDREPTITAPFAAFLGRFLPTVARQERATLLALGVVRTHLHLVVRIDPGTSLPRLLQRWKGGSSVIGSREQLGAGNPIRWAKGYNIESVSPRALAAVVDYVNHQADRHPDEAIAGLDRLSIEPSPAATPGRDLVVPRPVLAAEAAARQWPLKRPGSA